MQASHVLDSRPDGINDLKFQSFVHFGTPDYSGRLSPFLGTGDKDANQINRIEEAPLTELLLYNGVDALLERRLAFKQMRELGHDSSGE